MKKPLRILLSLSLQLFIFSQGFAQIPAGYYDDANGKTGYTLKTSLYNIIKGHSSQSYADLWTIYQTSDKKSNGKVWDMYSDIPGGTPAYEYTFVTDQCGNYSGEGSCYNREHSLPSSWFNDASPMYTDAFHIVPTDGYVNGRRGNYPFGEVASPTWTSTNGSKVGNNNISGYSGTAFEPIDEYKGDFARGFFYMATRYENIIAGWETNNANGDAMLNGTADQVFEDWALQMLIAWHNTDPVSQKEIDRNDAIHDFQGNRNPFIDKPEYVESIWGSTTTPTPLITVTSNLTDFGSVNFGEVSTTQSYSVSGTDLTEDIAITSNNGFEISLVNSDADFSNNITLTQTSGTVSTTTIFVRFKPESNANGAINGAISHTSAGATASTVNVSGTATMDANSPHLTVEESFTNFGEVKFGQSSEAQSYTVEGANLTNNVIITSSNDFEVSLDETTNFSHSIELVQESGTISTTTLFVRFTPSSDANDIVNGTIVHASPDFTNIEVGLSGTEKENVIPVINFTVTNETISPTLVHQVELLADVAPEVDMTIKVVKNGSFNLVLDQDYTTDPALENDALIIHWPANELTASFDVIFDAATIATSTQKRLSFTLSSLSGYTIGQTLSYEMVMEGTEVITATDNSFEKAVTATPNPAFSRLHINGLETRYEYTFSDMMGKTILKGNSTGPEVLDVTEVKSGNYILQITTDKQIDKQRIIIIH